MKFQIELKSSFLMERKDISEGNYIMCGLELGDNKILIYLCDDYTYLLENEFKQFSLPTHTILDEQSSN